jgi:class 3 adenylate cyclase
MDALSGRTIEGRKTVTVVFCDLVAYTELAERLDPEALFSTNTSTARSSTTSRGAGTAPTARAAAPGTPPPATARPAAARSSKP